MNIDFVFSLLFHAKDRRGKQTKLDDFIPVYISLLIIVHI